MKKLLYLLAGLALVVSSCTMKSKTVPAAPLNVQVNFTMDDLEFIGEVTGTTTQSYVLGLPYGNRTNNVGTVATQFPFQIPGQFIRTRGFNNAMYNALQSKPDADFILPIAVETKTDVMFLGREETLTIRAKAFKIKTK